MKGFPKCNCFRCTGKGPAETGLGYARSLLHIEPYIEKDPPQGLPIIQGTFTVNSDKIDGKFNIKDTTRND